MAEELQDGSEEILFHQSHVPTNNVVEKTWALVEDGFVVALKRVPHFLSHPYEATEGKPLPVAIDVTGVDCGVGYMVDAKGNVAPSNGRDVPLASHEPAYHDRSNPLAPHTADRMAELSTSGPFSNTDVRGEPLADTNTEKEQIQDKGDARGIDEPSVDKRDIESREIYGV